MSIINLPPVAGTTPVSLAESMATAIVPDAGDLVGQAMRYALNCHEHTNHRYAGRAYATHLKMVYDYGRKYVHLLPVASRSSVLAACWTHDTIEDCRQSYNDVKAACGHEVAEITYALTTEKGRNRSERANSRYYEGIRATPFAAFVKVCDRLANVGFSTHHSTRMLSTYRGEQAAFRQELWAEDYRAMFEELENTLMS